MFARILCVAMAVASVANATSADELNIGDEAPPLSVAKWVKGEKVDKFEPGKLYVVEFWATWCGPCRTSIPHLTELQKKHKDVAFIGVSILEDDFGGVDQFVEEMGEKMDYRVATDQVPEGKNSNEGKMAQGWMDAAGEGGIPTAFVINKEGKVAWIGHPMALDEPLAKIVAGDWDVAAAAQERKAGKERETRANAFIAKLQRAGSAKEAIPLLPELEELMASDPEIAARFAGLKFTLLVEANQEDKAVAYAEELAEKQFSESPQMLNNLAWTLIDPDRRAEPGKKAAATALKLAKKACDLTEHKEPGLLDTLALAHYLTGDKAKALEIQEQAVKLAGDDDQLKTELQVRLEKYRKEAGK